MRLLYLALVAAAASGCKTTILPSEVKTPKNAWKTFGEAQASYDRIIPHETTVEDLRRLGFDPETTPNMRLLTYLDITERFIPNASIALADLQEDVRNCIVAKDCCKAYELSVEVSDSQRYGNALMDIFGFRKHTHITGWTFRSLIIIQNDLVVYKLHAGQPNVNRFESKTKPLGPFQELDHLLTKVPKM